MEKKFIYSTSKIVGDVFYNSRTKETTMVLNLGFAGRDTFTLSSEDVTKKNGEVVKAVALRKLIVNNGSVSSVKVGVLFPATTKNGKQYHSGSFGLYSVYDSEKQKNITQKDDFGITIQLFKFEADKRKKLNDEVTKIGCVSMQIYIAEADVTAEGEYAPQPQDGMEGTTIKEEEIPF